MRSLVLLAFPLVLLHSPVYADGPKDNIPDSVRRIPPPGIKISDAERQDLHAGLEAFAKDLASLKGTGKKNQMVRDLLPDVEIYYRAVRSALQHDEFYSPREVVMAKKLLQQGRERVQALKEGKAPWLEQKGLVVRGYRSKIDGSVQPYGLVIPQTWHGDSPHKYRLDVWYHGRGEKLTELSFINQRQTQVGQFAPADTFVLHPYGRYSNANHFAGEVDTFEALEHAKKYYAIDENRLVVRGFSMGGAACWHMAVHHAGMWAAAAPGAGFSETPEFLRTFQGEKLRPYWWQKKLWRMYDATDYAINLFNCPTVAYSGEKDRQKQAADIMAAAMKKVGMDLVHIIGPNTGHSYHPDAKKEINRRIDAIAAIGRDPLPKNIRFTTFTLRYNKMHWITLDALDQHWERAHVEAEILSSNAVSINSNNVRALTINMGPGLCPLDNADQPTVVIDGTTLQAPRIGSDRSWVASFHKSDKGWAIGSLPDDSLRKRHGLQGPIDDAFMDAFVMVRPTGKSTHAKVDQWVEGELGHAIEHWRRQFRGEARVKDDQQITEEDIRTKNLILWGTPESNPVLAKVLSKLPLTWNKTTLALGQEKWQANHHVPVMIYPNPLNPEKYVVINSGFTYREYDYLNNARQVPRFGDWAILDINQPSTSQWPAGVVTGGFFDEQWNYVPGSNAIEE